VRVGAHHADGLDRLVPVSGGGRGVPDVVYVAPRRALHLRAAHAVTAARHMAYCQKRNDVVDTLARNLCQTRVAAQAGRAVARRPCQRRAAESNCAIGIAQSPFAHNHLGADALLYHSGPGSTCVPHFSRGTPTLSHRPKACPGTTAKVAPVSSCSPHRASLKQAYLERAW